jgi:hypothetical protein
MLAVAGQIENFHPFDSYPIEHARPLRHIVARTIEPAVTACQHPSGRCRLFGAIVYLRDIRQADGFPYVLRVPLIPRPDLIFRYIMTALGYTPPDASHGYIGAFHIHMKEYGSEPRRFRCADQIQLARV